MGPPLYAAEDVIELCVLLERHDTSMGPPLYAAEDAPMEALNKRLEETLQWGRRSTRRKTDIPRVIAHLQTMASMGPPLYAAEDRHAQRSVSSNNRLQWGRRSTRRKTR